MREMYEYFASDDSAAELNGLQWCLASVQSWMLMNKLKLNADNTEFLLVRNEQQQSKYLSMFPISSSGVKINPAKCAQNLGVIFDNKFTSAHIHLRCAAHVFNHIRDPWCICRYLNPNNAKLLAHALVSSHLDYRNLLLNTELAVVPLSLATLGILVL